MIKTLKQNPVLVGWQILQKQNSRETWTTNCDWPTPAWTVIQVEVLVKPTARTMESDRGMSNPTEAGIVPRPYPRARTVDVSEVLLTSSDAKSEASIWVLAALDALIVPIDQTLIPLTRNGTFPALAEIAEAIWPRVRSDFPVLSAVTTYEMLRECQHLSGAWAARGTA
jgi:hypothetical protein